MQTSPWKKGSVHQAANKMVGQTGLDQPEGGQAVRWRLSTSSISEYGLATGSGSGHYFLFSNSQFIHNSNAAPVEKKRKAAEWAAHLRSQYENRCIYYRLRYASRMENSAVLTIIFNGMDKSKFRYPQYRWRVPKQLDKFNKDGAALCTCSRVFGRLLC